MENIIAQNEHVTLRELRTHISATSEGKLPTFKQLMEMKSAVVAQKVVNTALLTVYQNGYAVSMKQMVREPLWQWIAAKNIHMTLTMGLELLFNRNYWRTKSGVLDF